MKTSVMTNSDQIKKYKKGPNSGTISRTNIQTNLSLLLNEFLKTQIKRSLKL
jgi:hypothetical protein